MVDLFGDQKEEIYKGAFQGIKNEGPFTEETFQVFRDNKEMSLHYQSEIDVRISTGELLKITVLYVVGKDWVPQSVLVTKMLGKNLVTESYKLDRHQNIITYVFDDGQKTNEVEITTAPRFHIATPSAATSTLFMMSKKFDNQGKNYYSVLTSKNLWEFEEDPVFVSTVVERLSLSNESIRLGGKKLSAIQYRLYGHHKNQTEKRIKNENIKFYLSKHIGVPYLVNDEKGVTYQIKFLSQLDA